MNKEKGYELLNWCPNKKGHLEKVKFSPNFPGMVEAVSYIKKYGKTYTTVKELYDVKEFLFFVPKINRKFIIQKI